MGWLDEAAKNFNPVQAVTNPVKAVTTPIKTVVKAVGKTPVPVKAALTPPKPVLPRVAIDKNTGKNIARNLNPGSMDPTGMTNAINRGVASLSTRDNLQSGLSKIGNSLANRSIVGGAFPNIMGDGSRGAQAAGGGAPGANPGGSQVKGFSLSQNSATPSAISGNEGNSAATDAIQRRYDLLQGNLRGREQAQAGMEQDALARRFASMGASNSGAALRNSQLTANMGAKRLGEQSNALAAQQSADQQGAIEAANARNLQREQLRAGENESAASRALQREQMAQQAQQFGQEYGLNQYITNENLKMGREDKRIAGRGINSLFSTLGFG